MKKLVLILLLLAPATFVAGQATGVYLNSVRPPVRLSLMTVYQRYVNDQTVSELSVPLSLLVPLGSNFGVSLQTSPASATGDALTTLGGMSDARVAVSYFGRLGGSSIGASVTANLPSGRRELTREEFATSVLLSQNMYDFRVPVFGQGLNVTPGVTFAMPLGERLVLGIGLAYQYRGEFTPIEDGATYDPGDEILVTGGIDAALGEAWSMAGDVTYAYYQMDLADGEDRYQSGNKIAATLQLTRPIGFNTIRLLARYRTRALGEIPVAGDLVTEAERMVPDQGLAHVSYRIRGSDVAHLTFLAQGRFFSETAAFPSSTLLDLGVMPEYAVADDWMLLLRFVYTVGEFSGFESGLGIAASL